MKPKEKKPEIVYRIFDRTSGSLEGAYSRAYCTEYDFSSVEEARSSNCYDIYQNPEKYRIARYKVTYELLDDDCT